MSNLLTVTLLLYVLSAIFMYLDNNVPMEETRMAKIDPESVTPFWGFIMKQGGVCAGTFFLMGTGSLLNWIISLV